MNKTNVISGLITILIVGLLILSGPVKAIDVEVITEDIYPGDMFKTFKIKITVNDNEFLPIPFIDLIFNDGAEELTCRIEDGNSSCDFINVTIETQDLNYGYGYGYGYGGYGYGYGYSTNSPGYYIYNLVLDISKLPDNFIGDNINLKVKVFGSEDNSYSSDSSFNVFVPIEEPIVYGSGGSNRGSSSFYSVGNPDDITRATPKVEVENIIVEPIVIEPEVKEQPKRPTVEVIEKKSYNWVFGIIILVVVAILGYFTFRKPKGEDIISS